MITEAFGVYLFIAGIVSLLILRFYGGKYWYVFLLLGVGFIGLRMAMKNVVILKEGRVNEKYLTLWNDLEYTFSDGRSYKIIIKDNMIINDSSKKVVVEKVEYSSVALLNFGDNIECTISPYKYLELANSIDYYYSEPPKTISVKRGGTTTRYWLHY